MPNKIRKLERDVAKSPAIPKELISLFVTGPMTGEAITTFVVESISRLRKNGP